MIESTPIIISKCGTLNSICRMRIRGAIFCQVEMINPVLKLTPWRTSGIQRCRGARPSFSPRAKTVSEAMDWLQG